MKHRTYGFFQVADPSGKAAFLMTHRNDKPIAAMLHAKKRSSPRVKRPVPENQHLYAMPRGYKSRITLANIWGSKP